MNRISNLYRAPRKRPWRVPVLVEDLYDDQGITILLAAGSIPHFANELSRDWKPGSPTYWRTDWVILGWRTPVLMWQAQPYEFDAALKLDRLAYASGHSKFVVWKTVSGAEFPMFAGHLVKLIKDPSVPITPDGQLTGRFKVVKRSQCYGIEWVAS